MAQDYYDIELAGIKRPLPLVKVAPGTRIAVLNILGDTELVEACASEMAKRLEKIEYDVFVTAESKSIPFTHALSVRTGKPYVVCRKNYKTYMGKALESTSNSITTQHDQHLILDEKDIAQINGKRIAIVDDVISTGSTLKAIQELAKKAGGLPNPIAVSICTEGSADDWKEVVALAHLPVFKD